MLTIDIIFVILIIVILFAVISFIRIKRIRADRNKMIRVKEQAALEPEATNQNKPEPCRPNCSVCPRKCTPKCMDFNCPNLPKCKLCPGVRVDRDGKECKPYCPVEYPGHQEEEQNRP